MKQTYAGKKVAVFGFGVEGRSSVEYFLQQDAAVTVYDRQSLDSLGEAGLAFQKKGVQFFSDQDVEQLRRSDLIVRAPGIPLSHHSLASVEQTNITSQAKLFLDAWSHRSIGVTGTKGKGTTSTLIHHFLHEAGQKAVILGNIGLPMLDAMETMDDDTWAVLELSSFQLQDVQVSPHIAVVLMIVPDHLDYHRDMSEYVEAKSQIVRHQKADDWAVIYQDIPTSRQFDEFTQAQVWPVSHQKRVPGTQITDTSVLLCQDRDVEVLKLRQTQLRGVHNLQNLGAAVSVGHLCGLSVGQMGDFVVAYKPLPHRLQLVVQKGNISYYNDSIATTPETVMAALESFGEPTVLILGGSDKGSDFTELAKTLKNSAQVKGVVLIGAIAPGIREAIESVGGLSVPVVQGGLTMPEIVLAATNLLKDQNKPGVVLLSPGAASYDMFINYKDRGEQFSRAVLELA